MAESNKNKIYCKKGTADKIPFNKNYFDIVIFNFVSMFVMSLTIKKLKKKPLELQKKFIYNYSRLLLTKKIKRI